MQAFREWVRRYEVILALFFIVLNNALFISAIHFEILPFSLYYKGRFALLGGTLLMVVLVGSGWKGILELLRPLTKWRISPWWFLLALSWPSLMSLLTLTGKGFFTGRFLGEITVDFEMIKNPTVIKAILLGSFVGEIVWVSYAIRKLTSKFTPFISSLIVGGVWTLWWMPMVILDIGVFPGLTPLSLLVAMLGVAAMCSFIYHHTESGLAVLSLQMMVNSTALVFPILPQAGGMATYYAFSMVYMACVVTLYLIMGPKPMFSRKASATYASGE